MEEFAQASPGAPGRRLAMDFERLQQDLVDAHARVQRGVGVLEDDLHAAAEVAQPG